MLLPTTDAATTVISVFTSVVPVRVVVEEAAEVVAAPLLSCDRLKSHWLRRMSASRARSLRCVLGWSVLTPSWSCS
jgi:hypothetical protein